MCGEHGGKTVSGHINDGSSPHVRGALNVWQIWARMGRIIPACAGSTHSKECKHAIDEDHPRMCGEHARLARAISSAVGSSPHVRGAPPIRKRYTRAGRIIPACAGSTLKRSCYSL